MYFVMYGVRTAARMAITATTTTTSISVNPFSFRFRIAPLLPACGVRPIRSRPQHGHRLPINYANLYIMILH